MKFIETLILLFTLTLSTPIWSQADSKDFTFDPGAANERDYHLTRFIVQMTHDTAGDGSRFGNILGGLTNGVYFGGRGLISGINIFNFVYNFRLY